MDTAEEKSSSPGGLKCQGDVFIYIYSSFGNPEEAGNNFGKPEEAGNSGEVWDLSVHCFPVGQNLVVPSEDCISNTFFQSASFFQLLFPPLGFFQL